MFEQAADGTSCDVPTVCDGGYLASAHRLEVHPPRAPRDVELEPRLVVAADGKTATLEAVPPRMVVYEAQPDERGCAHHLLQHGPPRRRQRGKPERTDERDIFQKAKTWSRCAAGATGSAASPPATRTRSPPPSSARDPPRRGAPAPARPGPRSARARRARWPTAPPSPASPWPTATAARPTRPASCGPAPRTRSGPRGRPGLPRAQVLRPGAQGLRGHGRPAVRGRRGLPRTLPPVAPEVLLRHTVRPAAPTTSASTAARAAPAATPSRARAAPREASAAPTTTATCTRRHCPDTVPLACSGGSEASCRSDDDCRTDVHACPVGFLGDGGPTQSATPPRNLRPHPHAES